MITDGQGIEPVADDQLSRVRGGRSFWGWVKKAAKWTKDHVVIGLKHIGIGGKF
ncbi:MAG: hypothetical protein QOD31_2723 [Pseudonocardiales bacterium]|nr:hypothetical protein [Pseudonocardiales bacterium]